MTPARVRALGVKGGLVQKRAEANGLRRIVRGRLQPMRCAHAEAVRLRVRDPALRSASDGDDTMPRELREVALIGFDGGKTRRHVVGAVERLCGELRSRLLVVFTRGRGESLAGTEHTQR